MGSVPSSGKSSPTSTELTQPVPTTETLTSSWRESTSTTTKPPVAVMSQEPSLWILSQVPWTPSEPDHSVSSSDQTTSSSVRPVPVTTGPRVTTSREPSSLTPSSMSSERRLRVAIAFRDSRSPTPSEEVPDPVWEPFSSPRSERSTQTDRCALSLSCHHQRCPIPSLSHTTPPSLSISSSRTPMMSCALTTRPSTISASEPSSSPPQPTEILTISSPPPSPVSPAASDSHVSTSSWLVSPHSPPVDPSSTEPSPSQSSPSRCSMPRTWCAPPTHVTDVTSPPPPSSEAVCPPRKSMSRCSMSRTRTLPTSLSGSPTTSSPPSAISHQRDSRWPLLSSETPPPSRRCSSVSVNNSPPCSEERPSSIGTPVKVWTRWSSLKLSPT